MQRILKFGTAGVFGLGIGVGLHAYFNPQVNELLIANKLRKDAELIKSRDIVDSFKST